jgi:F0F1-type ATP synthase membrane subunit b/b'
MEAEFWVRVAFFIFVVLLGYVGPALDSQHDRIKFELEEARRLKLEARGRRGGTCWRRKSSRYRLSQ